MTYNEQSQEVKNYIDIDHRDPSRFNPKKKFRVLQLAQTYKVLQNA